MTNAFPLTHRHRFWDAALVVTFSILLGAGFLGTFWGTGTAQQSAGILSLVCAACVAYGALVEPKRILVRRQRIVLPSLKGLRIAIASDFHVGPLKNRHFVQRVVEKVNAAEPDLILLPGDFLYDEYSDISELDPLKDLRARAGAFAVIGNHDTGHYLDIQRRPFSGTDRSVDVTTYLEERGIRVLRNEQERVAVNGVEMAIAGIDDLWPDVPPVVRDVLSAIDPEHPTILLSHHPDIIRLPEAQRARLIVSAHTHGGQIRLPFIGPILPIPSSLGRSFDRGLFPIGPQTQLFITHGTGETLLRARFFAPPEVVILEMSGDEE